MKKVVYIICLALLFQACYEDYKVDFDYSTTYFPRQFPLRTLVEAPGEDMTFEIGAVLGGKYSNGVNEEVSFIVQDTFLNASNYPQLTMLPANYYSIKSTNITIPSGAFQGSTTVTIDKDLFMSDPLSIDANFALPVEMVSTTADSILNGKHYAVIVLKYFNQYHGWYYVKGSDKNDVSGETVEYAKEDLVLNDDVLLTTASRNELLSPYVGNPDANIQGTREMTVTVNSDNSVTLSGGSGIVSNVSGTGTYDPNTRNFTLAYTYTDNNGNTHTVSDTLIYRNTELRLEEWKP